jgi:S-adenosylmethionine:tRNA ribosyltransferase-isomerase
VRVDDFDFELPPENIALRPANPRDAARLLLVAPQADSLLSDRKITDLSSILLAGDVLVCNDTSVIPARLRGIRTGRGTTTPGIEVTLHQKISDSKWKAFARPGRKLKPDDTIAFGSQNDVCMAAALNAKVVEKGKGGEIELAFDLSGPFLETAITTHGEMPLPPYIASKRPTDDRDLSDYQTMYAKHPGAVAAPTAGLHFTPQLTQSLKAKGIDLEYLTLHVGAGTFLPVKVQDTRDHKMHRENGILTPQLAARLNRAKKQGRRIIAVGTTALRLLESAADENGKLHAFSDSTGIFITPGYKFRFIDGLMTNFHLPKSTLFMLVCAFAGFEQMHKAYRHAIKSGYRFYSYGDSSLLFPKVSNDK